MSNTIKLTLEEYIKLRKKEALLYALEQRGLKNWEYYREVKMAVEKLRGRGQNMDRVNDMRDQLKVCQSWVVSSPVELLLEMIVDWIEEYEQGRNSTKSERDEEV